MGYVYIYFFNFLPMLGMQKILLSIDIYGVKYRLRQKKLAPSSLDEPLTFLAPLVLFFEHAR
eukprot:SAG31_NODE_1736_length_7404_cov_10.661465_5_plen_62_part_00